MSSMAWGDHDHSFTLLSETGEPIQAVHKSVWWPSVNWTKTIPSGRMQPCARMHGLVSRVQARFQPPVTSTAECLCAVHKHTTKIVTLNLSL